MTTTPLAVVVATADPPVEDVEFRVGRPFNPFDGENDEINLSVDLGSPSVHDANTSHDEAPRFWMQHPHVMDFEVTHGLMNDDRSLMMAPDEDGDFYESYRIDLSLEEEVDALAMAMNDVSF